MIHAIDVFVLPAFIATIAKRRLIDRHRRRSRGVGNHHDVGLQVVADFFEMDGWRVIQLGSDMPIPDLVQAVEFYQPDVLALSASLHTQLGTLTETIKAVRRGQRGAEVKILLGGRAFDEATDLARQFGADGYAVDPHAAVALGNDLVGLDGRPQVCRESAGEDRIEETVTA